MNKAQKLLKLMEEEEVPRSSLDKFLEPSQDDKEQEDSIEKFRFKKQLR